MANYIAKWLCALRNDILCDCSGGKNAIGIDVCVKETSYRIHVLCTMLYSSGGSWCNMTIKHMEICQFIVRKEFDHYI